MSKELGTTDGRKPQEAKGENNSFAQQPEATGSDKQYDRAAEISQQQYEQLTDKVPEQLDPKLHSKENLEMVQAYLKVLGTTDRNNLTKLDLDKYKPSEYDAYRKSLTQKVLGVNGNVTPEAKIDDIRRLMDLNNAEIAAWNQRLPKNKQDTEAAKTNEKFPVGSNIVRDAGAAQAAGAKPEPAWVKMNIAEEALKAAGKVPVVGIRKLPDDVQKK